MLICCLLRAGTVLSRLLLHFLKPSLLLFGRLHSEEKEDFRVAFSTVPFESQSPEVSCRSDAGVREIAREFLPQHLSVPSQSTNTEPRMSGCLMYWSLLVKSFCDAVQVLTQGRSPVRWTVKACECRVEVFWNKAGSLPKMSHERRWG